VHHADRAGGAEGAAAAGIAGLHAVAVSAVGLAANCFRLNYPRLLLLLLLPFVSFLLRLPPPFYNSR
jgi:hypothetical protein